MKTKANKFTSKTQSTTPKPARRPKPTFYHSHLIHELESTKLSYLKLLKSASEDTWNYRASYKTWSIKELFVHLGSYLWSDIPTAINNLSTGKKLPQFQPPIRQIINHLSSRLNARHQTKETLIKKYLLSHAEALKLLEKFDTDELQKITQTNTGTRTIEQLFKNHTRHFHEHEADLRKLITMAKP